MAITYTEYIAEYGSTAGEVANPACGQLDRENTKINVSLSVLVRA